MNSIFMILTMMIIGAILGGATNYLAIRMLFRPHEPIYIGTFRLPFTPGLIPRRRKEMAVQLGHLVAQYLLTPDSIKMKIQESDFRDKIFTWVKKESERLLRSNQSLSDVMTTLFQENITKETFIDKTEEILKEKMTSFVQNEKKNKIKEVLPLEVRGEIQSFIPKISRALTKKGAAFFRSEEGRAQLETLLYKFLEGKGSMVNFVGMMFGSDRIIEKVQPEIVRFFEDPSSEQMIRKFLLREWKNIEEKPFEVAIQSVDVEKIVEIVTKKMTKELSFYELWDKPLRSWVSPYETVIMEKWLPNVTDYLLHFLSERFVFIFQQFKLEEVVREQVDAFSVAHFEAMVLTIARRELKMITYLGGIIGGAVGFMQGILVLFF